MIKEPYHIFKDQSQGFLGVDDVMQQHDVGMLQALQKRRCRGTQGESVNRGHGADGLQDPASYGFLLAELSGFNIHSKRGAMGDQGEIKSEGGKKTQGRICRRMFSHSLLTTTFGFWKATLTSRSERRVGPISSSAELLAGAARLADSAGRFRSRFLSCAIWEHCANIVWDAGVNKAARQPAGLRSSS